MTMNSENYCELASIICHLVMIIKFFDVVNRNIKINHPCLQFI